jgi:hypothetical protein
MYEVLIVRMKDHNGVMMVYSTASAQSRELSKIPWLLYSKQIQSE